jgi:O-succinylbenzoic acid--CoA ligase
MPPIECPLDRAARVHGETPACLGSSGAVSWRELSRSADAVASALRDQAGVGEGDRVALLAVPSADWIPLLFGIFRLGAIACPLNARLPPAAWTERLRSIGAKLLLADTSFPRFETPCARMDPATALATVPDPNPRHPVDDARPATLLFTSGSMGFPRAVVHPLSAHLASAVGANPALDFVAGDRWLLSLPLYHVGGLAILFRTLQAGATVILPTPGQPLADAVLENAVTHLSLVPTQLERLLRSPDAVRLARTLKTLLLGGAPVPRDLLRRAWQAGLPARASYGMTETASLVTVAPTSDFPARESDGLVLPGRELRVADDGEIHVRGPVLPLGRWRDGRIEALVGPDGWMPTGDLGVLRDGALWVDGRRDNQFISGGENIQPEEIERALLDVTGASQAIVTPRPDAEYGQRPLAWLDLPADQWRPAEWEPALRKRLPGYMLPVAYRTLPAEEGLKPDRRRLIRESQRESC